MPAKKKRHQIVDDRFVWTTEDGDTVKIPLRIKLKVVRAVAGREMDAAAMFDVLEALIPDQSEALDEMDLLDFQEMFIAWQKVYEERAGATVGE